MHVLCPLVRWPSRKEQRGAVGRIVEAQPDREWPKPWPGRWRGPGGCVAKSGTRQFRALGRKPEWSWQGVEGGRAVFDLEGRTKIDRDKDALLSALEFSYKSF
jgi:hypothetical protein